MKNLRKVLILLGVFLAGGVVVFSMGWSANLIAGPKRAETAGPLTFPQMVAEALAQVPAISPAEASEAMDSNADTLVVDVRDASDIAAAGIIPGAVNISLGTLAFKADNQVPPEWRSPDLANRSRPIITTCYSGEMAALAGKLLVDMGFTNVRILKGGTVAWQAAGYSVQPLTPGWAYHYDTLRNRWYARHYAMTAKGFEVDGIYEMPSQPSAAFGDCGLNPNGPDC